MAGERRIDPKSAQFERIVFQNDNERFRLSNENKKPLPLWKSRGKV